MLRVWCCICPYVVIYLWALIIREGESLQSDPPLAKYFSLLIAFRSTVCLSAGSGVVCSWNKKYVLGKASVKHMFSAAQRRHVGTLMSFYIFKGTLNGNRPRWFNWVHQQPIRSNKTWQIRGSLGCSSYQTHPIVDKHLWLAQPGLLEICLNRRGSRHECQGISTWHRRFPNHRLVSSLY